MQILSYEVSTIRGQGQLKLAVPESGDHHVEQLGETLAGEFRSGALVVSWVRPAQSRKGLVQHLCTLLCQEILDRHTPAFLFDLVTPCIVA